MRGRSLNRAQVQLAPVVDVLNGPQFTIRDVTLAVRRRELDAVTCRERALGLSIYRHAVQPSWIVRDGRAGLLRSQRDGGIDAPGTQRRLTRRGDRAGRNQDRRRR